MPSSATRLLALAKLAVMLALLTLAVTGPPALAIWSVRDHFE